MRFLFNPAARLQAPPLRHWLVAVAVIFHLVGLVGTVAGYPPILRATPLHLLLMTALLAISFRDQMPRFAAWAVLAGAVGFAAEWVGVHTGLLFGDYKYGTVLGAHWDRIPLLMAALWVIVVSGAASLAQGFIRNRWAAAAVAGLLAAGLDWLIEPVAVRLGYWSWAGGEIPLFNYACWAGLAALLSAVWIFGRMRPGGFAVVLFLIQAMFFAILRLLL